MRASQTCTVLVCTGLVDDPPESVDVVKARYLLSGDQVILSTEEEEPVEGGIDMFALVIAFQTCTGLVCTGLVDDPTGVLEVVKARCFPSGDQVILSTEEEEPVEV